MVERHPSQREVATLVIRGNYIADFGMNVHPKHFIEMGDNSAHWAEISNNYFGSCAKKLIKNGRGNFGRMENNRPSAGIDNAFDNYTGWSYLETAYAEKSMTDNIGRLVMKSKGSPARPALTFKGEENTGICQVPGSPHTLTVTISGTEAARLVEPADGETALLVRRNVKGKSLTGPRHSR